MCIDLKQLNLIYEIFFLLYIEKLRKITKFFGLGVGQILFHGLGLDKFQVKNPRPRPRPRSKSAPR